MGEHTVKTEIFHPEELQTDLLQELNASPDHLYIKDHRIYLLLNGTVKMMLPAVN